MTPDTWTERDLPRRTRPRPARVLAGRSADVATARPPSNVLDTVCRLALPGLHATVRQIGDAARTPDRAGAVAASPMTRSSCHGGGGFSAVRAARRAEGLEREHVHV